MHSVFNISPKQHYGLAEAVSNISELPNGHFAVDEDFSYTEFIDSPYGDLKKIVGTSYSNKAIALLRYDTGDLCELAPYCDRNDTQRYIKSLDGRSTDYIQLPGDRRVASLAAPFHASEGLAGAQLVQHKDHSITVRYIPIPNWQGEIVLERLEEELRKRIGPELPIRFERVETIPRTERGKTRLVISEIETTASTGGPKYLA